MNTFQIAEDALIEVSRLQRETLERWALICATAGEYETAHELREAIEIEPEFEREAA